MKRKICDFLRNWYSDAKRKPLVMRGARQVGKTWLARNLAEELQLDLVEVNAERDFELIEIFRNTKVKECFRQLEIFVGKKLDPSKTLLFFDEVQAAPFVIPNLRWFYEDFPELAVIATGSLLDFVLEDHDFSMPVGRISYCHVEPMSFVEFLWANGEDLLADEMACALESHEIAPILHKKLNSLFYEYTVVGGLPAVVEAWTENHDDTERCRLQNDIIQNYNDDFNKYRKRINVEPLRQTWLSVASQLGSRFMYSHINSSVRQPQLKECLRLLTLARLCNKVCHTAANGIPLGAEAKEEIFKCVFIDTGLALNALGLRPITDVNFENALWANKGALAEQIAGMLMRTGASPQKSELFYWQQLGSNNAEIDYLIQDNGVIVPIEVKAGKSGSMKSLHQFMLGKKLKRAIRFDSNAPSVQELSVKTPAGEPVEYTLFSYPLYMAELVVRLG
ncbi:MAG: AAA family ATPase [Bacteroidales bacterium]|nr:AAA family ATPase [Bacteroidales bacterium]